MVLRMHAIPVRSVGVSSLLASGAIGPEHTTRVRPDSLHLHICCAMQISPTKRRRRPSAKRGMQEGLAYLYFLFYSIAPIDIVVRSVCAYIVSEIGFIYKQPRANAFNRTRADICLHTLIFLITCERAPRGERHSFQHQPRMPFHYSSRAN